MASHTIIQQVTAAGAIYSAASTVTDNQELDEDVTLAPAATNIEIDVVFTRASVKSLMIQSLGGDLTIKTNSSGAPNDTVVMIAGQIIIWSSVAVIGANPFPTADITKLFLSSTAGTKFIMRAILHSTNP